MFIYGLIDTRDGCLRYIGKTSNPVMRLKYHIEEASHRQKRCFWIRGLLKLGLKPLLEVLEETDEPDDAERFWIASLRAAGAQLLNMADGGDGCTMTPETRAKISATLKGVAKSQAHRDKLSKTIRARMAADPNYRPMDGFHGRHSAESKAKMSQAKLGKASNRKGKTLTPEQFANWYKARWGVKL